MREKAYLHIQGLIANGTLKGGSALSEILLAKELGSSRTPVREAIGQLVAEGFIEQTPTGSNLVVLLQRHDIVELYELREALELFAIEKAATSRIDDTDRKRLEGMVADILGLKDELEASGASALDAGQMRRFLACDLGFHSMLVSMTHNSRIHKVLNETRLLIRIFSMQRRGHNPPLLSAIHAQHRNVLEAVMEGRSAKAREMLSVHIRTSLKERLDEFDYWRRETALKMSMPNLSNEP